MLIKTSICVDIASIIEQTSSLSWTGRSIAINETTGNLLNGPYSIKDEFKNTPLGNVLTRLSDVGEARLLKLESGEVYTAHTDPDDRYHLNIISNPYCYLANLENSTLHSIPVDGFIWYMDTSLLHSALNLGGTPRVHLNVRKLLPAPTGEIYRIKMSGGDIDWKQTLYLPLMGYINSKIKSHEITGCSKINDREMLIGIDKMQVLDYIINVSQRSGFSVDVTKEN